MSDLTTHDVLVRAKAHLMQHGWTQGDFGRPRGPQCLLGALASCGAMFGTPIGMETRHALRAALTEPRALMFWNDAPERTFDEVIALLDEAILATAPTHAEPKVAA